MKVKMLTTAFASLFTAFFLLFGCSSSTEKDFSAWENDAKEYRNPVTLRSLPDPTIIKAADGWFYLYATEDTPNVPIMKSKDLIRWIFVNTAFTGSTRPSFEPNAGIWAPDINYVNGKYVMYYSMSVWGGGSTCGIGVAVADKPEGPFTDKGKLFRSSEIGVHNSIDPFFIDDEGKKYLFWGSFFGIYGIELSEDGLSLKTGSSKRQIAGTRFEAAYIHKKEGKYSLFASIGSCCEGLNSTYELVVGQSDNLFGPYLNQEGQSMMNNNYNVVISKNDHFVGNGHCSEIITDNAHLDWILYHGVDVQEPNKRVLLLDQVKWNEGWPYVETSTPSIQSIKPNL